MSTRVRAWLALWGPMLPLLLAEATIWVGFGALLPILPIFFVDHGVSLPMLGVVVAAWPAARLIGEPIFGWVADRANRTTMMVIGLFLASIFAVAPLFVAGPVAFIAWRALSGLAASIYDPAARGYLVDANPPERQGETFGLYGAAQMGGLMLGPAIGGVAAAVSGNPSIPFWVAGACVLVSGILVWARVREIPHAHHSTPAPGAANENTAAATDVPAAARAADPRPMRLFNRLLFAAIVLNVGSFFAGGTYEVVWSLYLTSLGAGLDMIGLTFFTFALPILVLSPVMGRYIDHEGGFLALVVGMAGIAICGGLYPLIPSVWFVVALGLVEGTAFALASPALFMLVARASPPGRSSTAQGIFGAAGTVGTIVASLSAGLLAEMDLRFPFFATGIAAGLMLLVGLTIGRRHLYDAMQPGHVRPAAGTPTPPEPAGL
ncbi:MAG: MFS transporter [Candidatus Limnocylindrales bacterium]